MRAIALLLLVCACSEPLDTVALADPATCEGCHPDQVREWASSMHAYASDDPVFVAMNKRGQRETGGRLGGLCIRCHAPFAVLRGATVDGTDVDALPRELRGVGCAACHQVAEVLETHNGGLAWSEDGTMRGGLAGARSTPAHRSTRSATASSSELCGACHDVVLPSGLEVESTYTEWSGSVFARGAAQLTCAQCHMFVRTAPAARGGPPRQVHDHSLPGVDVAMTAWPGSDAQRAAIERDLRPAITSKLCVEPHLATVTLDNAQIGHAFPSGTTHARRVWLELVAETAGQVTQRIDETNASAWVLRSRFYGADHQEVQFVWQAEAIESELLSPSVTLDRSDPAYNHSRSRSFAIAGSPDTIRIVLHEQPIGRDILAELVTSGDLDPAVVDTVPTYTLTGTQREWHASDGYGCTPR